MSANCRSQDGKTNETRAAASPETVKASHWMWQYH